ncbi:nitrite reductase small subunit NirD [Flagellimonas sp. CMM7]|uniref:nitrite reductase small subunit NirD n=1 Tax=Flagellimonas sp. CMM7 TaxID=2654676 RepID=UPI0013D832E1|nr:nitrite reductase small subunit NirD [Flagellimonas sp. CMM7]UII81270.1 nitrite reductase small subunit NirD [Flagellimonas sp. CMM7]
MDLVIDQYQSIKEEDVNVWFKVAPISAFPKDGGACVKYKDKQIAVYNFTRKEKWYACQNLCPHKMEMVLSRGMIGDVSRIAKVACPLHKKTFSLETGENLNGDLPAIATYPVKIEDGFVYLGFSEL